MHSVLLCIPPCIRFFGSFEIRSEKILMCSVILLIDFVLADIWENAKHIYERENEKNEKNENSCFWTCKIQNDFVFCFSCLFFKGT